MKKVICIGLIFMSLSLVGCGEEKKSNPTATNNLQKSAEQVAQNQSKLETLQPAPSIEYSNARDALIKRATTFNDPNKVSYIYLISKQGTVMAFYTVKGTVVPLSSYLVPDDNIVKDPYYDYTGSTSSSAVTKSQGLVIQNPDIDGTYGSNGDGIFFYTTDDVYVQWNGEYMLCDAPLKLTTQPVLTREIE
jgi:hypothetical protein